MSGVCSPVEARIEIGEQELAMVVEPGEPVFAGHYPGFRVFPGVCVVEFVHRGALAVLPERGRQWELSSIDKVRFTGPVFPGDSLSAGLRWQQADAGWTCVAAVTSERGSVAQVRISFSEKGPR